jgi:type II secretory pathway component GspD/PulD (secretin)
LHLSRLLTQAAWLGLCLALPVRAETETAAQALQKAITLFDEANYLAAQETLLRLDRDALTDKERALRDDYVERVGVAVKAVDKAKQDVERAQAALAADQFDTATSFFEGVLDNEYAPASVRQAADEGLREVAARRARDKNELKAGPSSAPAAPERTPPAPNAPVPPPAAALPPEGAAAPAAKAPPEGTPAAPENDATARARILTQRAYAALDEGRMDEALGMFNRALTVVPGYPEAVAGVEQVRAHQKVESGSMTPIERIHLRNQVRWQRVVASFRDAEAQVRAQVMADRYDLAKQALLQARQIVESGKEFAEPLSRYESLRAEGDALAQFVEAEERHAEEARVRKIREEASAKASERVAEESQNRQRRVDALMNQAFQERKDGNFEAAINVLEQVVAIDTRNEKARWMLDDLEDTWNYVRQREALTEKRKQTQGVLSDIDETKIPWHENLTYPKNWLEIISRPTRGISGTEYLSPEDQTIKNKLAAKIPINFEDTPFGEVISTLSEAQQVNITVVWSDLLNHSIDQETPVNLVLPSEVTFKKALEEILAQLGGGTVELRYVVNEGIIKIATRALLDRETLVEVYDISDLLMRVPDFPDAPSINLQQGGGGGGPGGGSASQNPFQGGQSGGGTDEDNRTRKERAEEIVELIRETIEPESWREGASAGTEASIRALEANLVVTQTASAHEQIADLLSQLRQERAIQIAVEARFLTVTANYLEELGIDLDVILNQGNAGFDRVNGLDEGTALLLPRSFSRLGFTPATPGVGVPLDPRGIPNTSVTNIRQPYGNVALVPSEGEFMNSGSRMTPVPILSNVLDLTGTQKTSIPGSLGGGDTPAMQIFGSFLDNIQVDFMLRATEADRRGSTMSAPRLVLFNGQRAWVGVLREQAYVSNVQPVVDETAVAQQPQTSTILTGTVLDVQATVSADKRYITMTLRPGVATLEGIQEFPYSGGAAGTAAGGGFIQLPTVQRQVIRTTVSVPDGGTLLIGGMKVSEEVEIEAGVPVLSKIPVLKRLYSNRSLVKDEQVLLILIKPTILITREAEEAAFPTFGSRG